MRYSAIVLALSVMTAMVPQSFAQTQPANTGTPPAAQEQHNTHSRAKGAAAGAAIGAVSGNAGKGAAAGMVAGGMATRHNRREERRAK